MKESTKNIIKNYAIYLCCLLGFAFISFFLFKIPYIGKELLEIDASNFFATSVYRINIVIYILGNVFFCGVFALIWFLILNNKLNNIKKLSKLGYWIGLLIFIMFLFLEFVVFLLAQLTSLGISFYLKNGYLLVDIFPFIFMFVIVLFTVIRTIKRGAK